MCSAHLTRRPGRYLVARLEAWHPLWALVLVLHKPSNSTGFIDAHPECTLLQFRCSVSFSRPFPPVCLQLFPSWRCLQTVSPGQTVRIVAQHKSSPSACCCVPPVWGNIVENHFLSVFSTCCTTALTVLLWLASDNVLPASPWLGTPCVTVTAWPPHQSCCPVTAKILNWLDVICSWQIRVGCSSLPCYFSDAWKVFVWWFVPIFFLGIGAKLAGL